MMMAAVEKGVLSLSTIDSFRKELEKDPSYLLAQNVVSRSNPVESCLRRKALETASHVYSHKVDEAKPTTNQKMSGRCWVFACLNAARIPFMKAKNMEDFEFSQGHLFFWDKVERSNYFLNAIADVYCRVPKEDPTGRLVSFLLSDPVCDGGQWDMAVNLIEKHGLVPKACFPEAWSCENSRHMNSILKSKLREFAHAIHKHLDAGNDEQSVRALIKEQMKVVFRIVSTCLGTPPTQFTWEYYDKSKKYNKVGPTSPVDFYKNHVKDLFDATSKVCLVTDPRSENPVGRTYTVDCLGNVVGGKPTIYNNQSVETLMKIAGESIIAGEPVWFGCDVGKNQVSQQGILDVEAHDYSLVYGTDVNRNLSKADRLVYGDSQMCHAMLLTGIHVEKSGVEDQVPKTSDDQSGSSSSPLQVEEIKKWRVENSWGEDRNEKGYLTMTNDWFREFVFEVVVDRKFCPKEVLDVLDMEPKILPAWDPMASLARLPLRND